MYKKFFSTATKYKNIIEVTKIIISGISGPEIRAPGIKQIQNDTRLTK